MGTAVGIFAGRGDVILAMGMAFVFGSWVGWKLKEFSMRFGR
jgi:hypothetical protein